MKDKNPRKILIIAFLITSAPTLTLNYLSLYLRGSFSLSQVDIGIAYTLIAIGTVIGIVFSGIFSDRIGKFKLSKIFFMIMFISLIPIPFIKIVPIIIGFVIIYSIGMDGGWTSYQALCSEVVPERRGTFMSLLYTVNAMTITFYSLFGPIIYGFGGFKLIMAFAILSVGLALILINTLDLQ